MTSIDTFLSITVPNILKSLNDSYLFCVVAGRALYVFLEKVGMSGNMIPHDWDILLYGSEEDQNKFVQEVINLLTNQGYKISKQIYNPEHDNNDIYDLRGRSWITLRVTIGDNKISFMDVYRTDVLQPEMEQFIPHDGLLYSDLGFLTRELNRREDSIKKMIQDVREMSAEDIKQMIEYTREHLVDANVDINLADQSCSDLVYGMDGFFEELEDNIKVLNEAKKSLQKVVKNRDLLFGTLLKGNVSKEMIGKVCTICRELESQYNRYMNLANHCDQLKTECKL
jgi:hypothetical protein